MVFAEYYHKKRAEGKPHRVAQNHVAKKLIRVIYTLETTDASFDWTGFSRFRVEQQIDFVFVV